MTDEYSYANADPPHTLSYLLPVLERQLRDVEPGSRVLDLGCGNGALTAAWAQPLWHVTGIDSSISGIEFAKNAHPSHTFRVCDATSPLSSLFAEESFDAVVSTEVIEHVFAPRRFLQNAFEVLKPSGKIILSTPYHGYLKNVLLALSGNMDTHFTALWDGGHIKFWSRRTLSALLEEAGFSQIEFYGAGRVPYVWNSMILVARKGAKPTPDRIQIS